MRFKFNTFTMRYSSFFFVCALMAITLPSWAQSNGEVVLRHTVFTPSTELSRSIAFQDFVSQQPQVNSRVYCWVQFANSLDQAQLDLLRARDVRLQGYVRPHTYLVSIPLDEVGSRFEGTPLRAVHAYEVAHKAAADILPMLTAIDGKSERIEVFVFFHEDLPGRLNAQALQALQLRPHAWYSDSTQARIFIHSHHVHRLTSLANVRYLELAPGPGEPDDQWARAIHRSGLIQQPGANPLLSYDGSGIKVLVRDDGRVGPHIDYQGRLNQEYSYRPETDGTHGDMVAGIVSGANNLRPFAQGMASGSLLYIEDYRGDFPDHTTQLIDNEGIVITNSSYSDGCNTGYTGRTVRVDDQIFERPHLMHVFSAGNAGTNDCDYGAGPFWGNITGGHKAGKNSIAVANLFSDYGLVNSSSRGPVYDGRIKPDISAHGQGQLTTFPNHTINPGGGTSAAAPGVAGVMAQLYQVFEEYHPGLSVPSALIKAAMLVTATDMGQPGPDFIYGWGHVNGYAAHHLLAEGRFEGLSVMPGEVLTRQIHIPEGLEEARIMIYWADPASMPQSARALVADVDIRVQPPGGSSQHFPLVLDHTPDPTKLNLPAVEGIDRRNNMEQVRLEQPNAGIYNVEIEGHELPFGAAEVWLVYEFLRPAPLLAYPVGGESFRPQQSTRVYWEAARDGGPWEVDFSADGGTTWTNLQSNVAPSRRHIGITIPNVVTHQGYIRLSRDGTMITHERPIHVLPEPGPIEVVKACPDTLFLSWNAVPGVDGYDVFTLGEKYIEVVGTSDTHFYALPTWNPLADNWMALRSNLGDSIMSERTEASLYNAGLRECKQAVDLRGVNIASPFLLRLVRCEPDSLPIIVSIRNEGTDTITNVPILYQIGDKDPVAGVLTQTLNPNAVRFYKLVPEPFFDESGMIPIKVWCDMPGEDFRFNDTIYASVEVRLLSADILEPDFVETFEGQNDWPPSWFVVDENEDGFTWSRFRVGLGNGDTTTVAVMANYFYDQIGERDILVTPLVELPPLSLPRLVFDVAYSGLAGQGEDSLLVFLSTDCGETVDKVIYARSGNDLITIDDPWTIFDPFVPNAQEQWRTEELDLSDYAGQRVQLQFVNVTGFGNNVWLNNVGVIDQSDGILMARFDIPDAPVCEGDTVQFVSLSTGIPDAEDWIFGMDALPPQATGSGPHEVMYEKYGHKLIQLEVGRDTLTDGISRSLEVIPRPVASLSAEINGDTLYLDAGPPIAGYPFDYFWFLDGILSGNTASPSFALADLEVDSLRVTLTVCNVCGCDTKEAVLMLTSVRPEPGAELALQLHPNPGRDLIYFSGELPAGHWYMEVMDMAGRITWQYQMQWPGGNWIFPLEVQHWVSGSYVWRMVSGTTYHQALFIKE